LNLKPQARPIVKVKKVVSSFTRLSHTRNATGDQGIQNAALDCYATVDRYATVGDFLPLSDSSVPQRLLLTTPLLNTEKQR
jgi:hypothetical protein